MKGIYKLQSKIALHELFDIEAVAKSEKWGYQLMHMQIASVSSWCKHPNLQFEAEAQ